ncbi:MAG: hypothetical protein IPG89_04370 [Bacteroidetes bacterium]|nr:hypothetical protein [Bacteroidota bacterium]
MKEIKEHWYRYVFGLLIGLAGVLLVSFCTPKLLHPQIQETSCKGNCAKYLKISKDSLHELIAVFDNSVRDIKNIDEKINSINTRINDFYIFAGILITLLLVINVSVYIKTAS